MDLQERNVGLAFREHIAALIMAQASTNYFRTGTVGGVYEENHQRGLAKHAIELADALINELNNDCQDVQKADEIRGNHTAELRAIEHLWITKLERCQAERDQRPTAFTVGIVGLSGLLIGLMVMAFLLR